MEAEHEGGQEAEQEDALPEGVDPRVVRLFDDTRKKLVDTGTRNRLIHVNRANSRGKLVNIVNERSEEIYSILSSGKAMRLHALGKDTKAADDETIVLATYEDEFEESRYTDNLLETLLVLISTEN